MTSQRVASDAGRALRLSSDRPTRELAGSALSQYSLRDLGLGTCRYTGNHNQGDLVREWQAHQRRSGRRKIVALANAERIGPRYLPNH